jgi:hypothetical protein
MQTDTHTAVVSAPNQTAAHCVYVQLGVLHSALTTHLQADCSEAKHMHPDTSAQPLLASLCQHTQAHYDVHTSLSKANACLTASAVGHSCPFTNP